MNCKNFILTFMLSVSSFLISAQTNSILLLPAKTLAANTGIERMEYKNFLQSYGATKDKEAEGYDEEEDNKEEDDTEEEGYDDNDEVGYDDDEYDSGDELSDESMNGEDEPEQAYASLLIIPNKMAIIKAKGTLLINATGVTENGEKEDITQKVTYQSSDTKIVTVSKEGKIITLKKGTAKVTVTIGKLKKEINVTVR